MIGPGSDTLIGENGLEFALAGEGTTAEEGANKLVTEVGRQAVAHVSLLIVLAMKNGRSCCLWFTSPVGGSI